jgi:dissimilatory sulfite reductase (desulfoviridin) alpha/beta subunit
MSDGSGPDVAALKLSGVMQQKEEDLFTLRLRIVGGHVDSAQLVTLAGLADRYGQGHVHLTTRQGAEIPNVRLGDVEKVTAELARVGLELGQCGARVRTITACQGKTCRYGLIDCHAVAQALDARLFGRGGLPHKFKIAVTGCPNSCAKPQENEVGVMGNVELELDADRCNLCGICVRVCWVEGALSVDGERLVRRDDLCSRCGVCVAVCPTDAWRILGERYAVYVGGKIGRRPRFGDRLPTPAQDVPSLLALVEDVLDWYATNGRTRERLGDTLDRLGTDALVEELEVRHDR